MDKKDSKRPLQPGDRITVCGYDSRGVINENAWHVVESINGDWITCKFHDGLEKPVNVHRRQCRRLRPKRKREAWTVWIQWPSGAPAQVFLPGFPMPHDAVEFREVLPKRGKGGAK
jgi:hypothetical protein